MPICKVCMKRIDVSKTGIMAHKCRLCGNNACREHFDVVRNICHKCIGKPPLKKSHIRANE